MERFQATIEFHADNRDAAEHLFKAFCTCIADHVKYQAVLRGAVQMNLCVVNKEPAASQPRS
jgi:hypothetical protein